MEQVHHRLAGVTARHDRHEPSVKEPEEMQQDDHDDRHASEPKNDIAQHGLPHLRDCTASRSWTKGKARGQPVVAMVATLLSSPPSRSQRDQQADSSNEAA